MDYYDYVIIGGGMSGLYFNYNLRKRGINNILLLEKEDTLGGRSISLKFKDAIIQAGTGIGIATRDHTLLTLLNELKVEYNTFTTGTDKNECLDILAKLYKNISITKPDMTFDEYCKLVLSKDEANILFKESGYTDFKDANALMTMNYYGLESNYKQYIGIGINWTKLVTKLSQYLNEYKTSCEVLSISNNTVTTSNGIYKCENIVIASTISVIQKLTNNQIYQSIRSHPFMRIYASFEGNSKEIMNDCYPTFTRTYNRLHFISKFSDNVFMIAYTDGEDAIFLYSRIIDSNDDEKRQKKVIERYLPDNVIIDEMRVFYWSEAIHQYKTSDVDFNLLRNPQKGLYVVGEAVADIQGWTEGALRSINSLFKNDLLC